MSSRWMPMGLAVVFLFVGAVLGGLLAPRSTDAGRREGSRIAESAPPASRDSSEAQQELLRSIRELADAIARLEAVLLESPRSRDPVSEPGQAVDTATLAAALDRLSSTVQRDRMLASGFPGASEVYQGFEGAATAATDAGIADRLRGFAGVEDYQELYRLHRFWSWRKVLETYGVPDRIQADGPVVLWSYRIAADGKTVGLKIYEGIVIDVWN